jgi:hypothetical protein
MRLAWLPHNLQGENNESTKLKGLLTEMTEEQKDSPKVQGPLRIFPRRANDILMQLPVADG